MRVVVATALTAVLASCHLADSPQTDCPAGSHPELGRCVVDPIDGANIVITANAAGTSCSGGDAAADRPPVVAPDPFHLTAGAAFHFVNQDDMDHEIRGVDGQVWATVPKGHTGPDETIAKAGTWQYTVSGCKGGTILVQ